MAVALPSMSADERIAAQRYCAREGILRDLHNRQKRPIIPTNCPTLDWATGIGGFPRGRVIEVYGPESSGKCSLPNTLVPVPGHGILTLEEMAELAPWEDGSKSTDSRTPGTHAPLFMEVVNAFGTTQTTHSYFPGPIDTTLLFTQHGHTLQGSPSHRILTLSDYGLLNWTTLANARPGYIVFSMLNTKVTNKGRPIYIPKAIHPEYTRPRIVKTVEFAALMGALATTENRQGAEHVVTSCALQRRTIRDWAAKVGIEEIYDPNPKWTSFTGLAKLMPEMEALAKLALHKDTLKSVRTSSIMLQRAWAGGLSLTRGQWTHDHLEVEVIDEEVARVFQAICENVGVRWTRYSTLNTFGDVRWKLALRSRGDQQRAEQYLWDRFVLPSTWRKFYSPEEDENPELVKKTIEMARDILVKAGGKVSDIDLEDTSKDNCKVLADRIAPLPNRNKTMSRLVDTLGVLADERVTSDIVGGTQAGAKVACYDLSVPIGQHYAANGLVSHNSTVALHTARNELASRPDATVVYMDFERAVPEEYVEAMGLMEYADRFFLIDPNSLEQGNKTIVDMYREKLRPSLVIVDSVAAATPQDLFARDMEDTAPVALRARKWAEIMETWTKYGGDYGTMFMLLNQVRTKINTDPRNKPKQIVGAIGAENEETPGGKAIKFYSSMRIRLEPMKVVVANSFNPMTGEEESMPIANLVKAFFIKNKLAAPFRKGTFFIQFGKGIDVVRTMVEIAIIRDLVQQGGRGTFQIALEGGRVIEGRGEEGLVDALKADRDAQIQVAKLLQWDQADKLTAEARSFTTLTPGVGATTETGTDTDSGILEYLARNHITVSMVSQAPTLAEKGMVLGFVEKSGRAFVYKSSTGSEVRAGTLSSMNDKLKGVTRDDLLARVEHSVELLTELQQQETPPTALDTVPPEGTGGTAINVDEPPAVTPQ